MLSFSENVAILIGTIIGSMSFMAVLNRAWPCERRQSRSDLISWQLSILGTIYAIILGFMLYTVWTEFGAANLNADLEASSLRNLYRLAAGLPDQQRSKLLLQTRQYAAAVIKDDWPAMARGEVPEKSHRINEDMWKTLTSIRVASPSESTAEDHAISELSQMTTYRRIRLLQSVYRLPAMFWCVLLVGGVLTLVAVVMFGSANRILHAIQVFSLTLLITLVMLAIADVNRPFQGWIHVDAYGFSRALENMTD